MSGELRAAVVILRKEEEVIRDRNPWADFWRGFGQILDIGGTMGPTLPDWMDHPDPDAEAIRRDWQAVGDVMRMEKDWALEMCECGHPRSAHQGDAMDEECMGCDCPWFSRPEVIGREINDDDKESQK